MKDQTPPTPATVGEEALPTSVAPSGANEASPSGDKRRRVFLAWTTDDIAAQRDTLAVMLEKAGMEVFPMESKPTDEAAFKLQIDAMVQKADLSIHLLGGEFGAVMSNNPNQSHTAYQYEVALEKSRKTKGAFKRVVWNLPLEGLILQGEQADFVVQVQNNVSREMMFTSVNNAAQFIDETRAFIESTAEVKALPKEYDIAFISNVADAADCYHMVEKLGEERKLATLTIVPEADTNYRNQAADLIRRSRLTVVYFKESSDWAISFVKQLWKYVGGASGTTPFLLIGEDEPRRNRFLRFKAPQTLMMVVHKDEVLKNIQETYAKIVQTGQLTEETFCPYTGLRPFNEDESIFFKGREKHVDYIIDLLQRQKFVMVTGSSGDGKSSLVFAGMIPNLKGGFLKTQFSKWAVADFRPERQPLRNLATALSTELRMRNPDDVENALSYGFSALVDLYKKSPLYCDMTSQEYIDADEEGRKSMRRKAANLLVLVDQFEEFFTNIENYRDGVASPIAQITVNVLVETVRIAREENLPIYVVCTMRSDYIGQCVAFRGFAEMIGLSTYYVPRLKREEVQEVIQGPAELNGNTVSLRLAQRLLNDLGDGIDQLPVLQHSLHQIWTDADLGKQEMDLLHYARVGGLAASKLPKDNQNEYTRWFASQNNDKQALYDKPRLRNVLNRHANELYNTAHDYYNARYTPGISQETAQAIIKTAFICLTKVDENRAVRNRMTVQDITDIHGDPAVDAQMVGRVMNIFRAPGNTFVQPYITDDPDTLEVGATTVLDITHESLIRNWERLTEWAEQEDKSVKVYSDFKKEVNRWIDNDSNKKYLLLSTGTFDYFNSWYQSHKPNAAWIKRYFRPEEIVPELDPMEQGAMYLEDIQDFLEGSRKEINRRKRLRNLAISVVLLLTLLGFILAFFANQSRLEAVAQKQEAEKQKVIAESQKREAERQRLEAENQKLLADRAYIRAQLEALNAKNQTLIAEGALLDATKQKEIAEVQRQMAELRRQEAVKAQQFAENQRQIAEAARYDAEISEGYAVDQSRNAVIERDNALITQSLFLAAMAEEQSDQGRNELGILLALRALPETIGDSNQRPYVEEAEAALYYTLNREKNSRPDAEMFGHTNRLVYNQFSPDSKRLISTSWDKTARIWDVASGKEISRLSGHSHIVEKAYMSADGNYVITQAEDFSARVWDLRSNKLVAVLRGHDDLLTHVAITNDAQRAATTSLDNNIRLWRINGADEIAVLEGHTDDVLYAAFSLDGRRLVSASADGTVRIWNGENGAAIHTLTGHSGAVRHVAFSPSGQYVASVGDDGTARVWDATSGRQVFLLRGHKAGVLWAAFSADGGRLATAGTDSTARVWDMGTGSEIGLLKGHKNAVYNVQFSNDGLHMVTSSDDSTVRLWDAESYLRIAVYNGNPRNGYAAAFSPNSRYVAVAGKNGNQYTVRVYDLLPNRQELIDLARQQVKRDLTQAELQQFFLDDKRLRKARVMEKLEERRERLRKQRGATVPTMPADPSSVPQAIEEVPASQMTPGPDKPDLQAIPADGLHTVSPGETLFRIARRYGIPLDKLKSMNGLKTDMLKVGQKLKLR